MLNGLGWVLWFGTCLALFCLGFYLGRVEAREDALNDQDIWGDEACDIHRYNSASAPKDDRSWCFTHASFAPPGKKECLAAPSFRGRR